MKYLLRLLQLNVHIYVANVLVLNAVVRYSRVSLRERKSVVNFNGILNFTINDLNDIYKTSTFYKISKYKVFIYYEIYGLITVISNIN